MKIRKEHDAKECFQHLDQVQKLEVPCVALQPSCGQNAHFFCRLHLSKDVHLGSPGFRHNDAAFDFMCGKQIHHTSRQELAEERDRCPSLGKSSAIEKILTQVQEYTNNQAPRHAYNCRTFSMCRRQRELSCESFATRARDTTSPCPRRWI
jgi:hypothetical protein